MQEKTKTLIVDDHSLTLIGIQNIVEKIDFIEVIGTASSAKDALNILNTKKVDILMTDIEMKYADEGIELSKIAKNKYPGIKVIVVTQHSEPWIIGKLITHDIDAIILKSKTDSIELEEALNCIQSNEKYYSSEIKESVFQTKPTNNSLPYITSREKEVLILICKEYTTQKIAKKLTIAESTVDSHRKNLTIKLKVKSQSGLVREAIRYGFYTFE